MLLEKYVSKSISLGFTTANAIGKRNKCRQYSKNDSRERVAINDQQEYSAQDTESAVLRTVNRRKKKITKQHHLHAITTAANMI